MAPVRGASEPGARRGAIAEMSAARRRAQFVSGMRGLTRPADPGVRAPGERSAEVALGVGAAAAPEEWCDICKTRLASEHRHLLNLVERRIECTCETCWARHSGDPEYRPTGGRTLWLPDLDVPDEVWASFQIPIGLAFFMASTVAGCVVALYPSPGGATESELHFSSWSRIVELNPLLADLEPDVEGLIVNRLSDPRAYAIAPIDRCYALTGTIKLHWEGISGGPAVREAVSGFFEQIQSEAVPV